MAPAEIATPDKRLLVGDDASVRVVLPRELWVKSRYEDEATAASNIVVILGTENGYRMLALDQVTGQLRVYGNSPDNNRSTEPSNMADGRFNEEYPLITSDLKWSIRPLTIEEMNKVIAELSENGIPYELINAPSNEKNLIR